jgi:hypothetical protein
MCAILQLLKLFFQTGQFVLVHSAHKTQPYKNHTFVVHILIIKCNCTYCSLISIYSSDFPISVSLASSVSEKMKVAPVYLSFMRTEFFHKNDMIHDTKTEWKKTSNFKIYSTLNSCFHILLRIPLSSNTCEHQSSKHCKLTAHHSWFVFRSWGLRLDS